MTGEEKDYNKREEAEEFYKAVGSVRCPALGGECVHFTSEGFNHLISSTRRERRRHAMRRCK
jgi:hypothetical protein